MFRLFKLPLIVTVVALVLVTVVGIGVLALTFEPGAPRQNERAQMLGQGLAVLTIVLVSPFWIYAVLKMGQERRAELKQAKSSATTKKTKRRPK